MAMQQEVYAVVVAQVKSGLIPDNSDSFVKDLEKQSGVTCTINYNESSPVYMLQGSLLSIQNAASFIQNRHKTRQEGLLNKYPEASEERLSSTRYRCKAVSGCDGESTGRKIVNSRAARLSLSESERQPYKDKTPTKDALQIGNDEDCGSSVLGKQETIYSDQLKGSRVGEDEKDSESPAAFRYPSYYEPSRYSQSSDISVRRNKTYPEMHGLTDMLAEMYNGSTLSFKTPLRHHLVSVYNGDLTKVKVEGIVCAANSYLAHGGGVSKAIAEVGGYQVEQDSIQYIQRHGPLYPSQVAHTRGGQLPSKYVIHAVGPEWKEYKNKTECLNTLKETFINCFRYAEKDLVIKHIALPLISSGTFGVPVDKCFQALYKALMEYDRSKVSRKLDIHIVDTNVESVKYLQTQFSECLKSNSIPFDMKGSEPSPSRSDMIHSSDISCNGRNGYTLYADTLSSKIETSTSVVEDFPSEEVKKTDRYSSRKGDTSSKSSWNCSFDTTDRKYKENSHDRNSPTKYKEGNGRNSSSEMLAKNPRLSPHNGTMRALSSHHSPEESIDLVAERYNEAILSFKTPFTHHLISVYNGDLTKLKVDAIVNAANSYLAHDGGVAKAITKVGGYQVKQDSDQYIRTHGPLSPSEVGHTRGGQLPSKYVIHAVGPRWKEYKNATECLNTLKETFINCFRYAESYLRITHVALPLISSGIFGVPIEKCFQALYEALMEFDRSKVSGQLDIHIVDTNVETVKYLQTQFSEYLKSDSIPFNKKGCEPSVTVHSSDVSSNGRNDYALAYADTVSPKIETGTPVVKDFPVEDAKKTNRYSTRKGDSLSTKSLWNSLDTTDRKYKENRYDRNSPMKHKEKAGKNVPSEFRVRENLKLSPLNGPMRALSSQSSHETRVKNLLEDHESKGYPADKFREMQYILDKILGNDSMTSTKDRRSKSLDRLPSTRADSGKSLSGERQSRRDSSKIRNKEGSGLREGSGYQRSQSVDRRRHQDESEKMETKDFDKNLMTSEQELVFTRGGFRQPKSDSSKSKKREDSRHSRSQSLDRLRQKNGGDTIEKIDAGRDIAVTSQQKPYFTRCSQCHSEKKIKKHKHCVHMICTRCYSMQFTFCIDCKNGIRNQHKIGKGISPSVQLKRDIKLAPRFESQIDSNSAFNVTDARRRRREKPSLNQTTQDKYNGSAQRNNVTELPPPLEYTGDPPVDEIQSQSLTEKENIQDVLITQPAQVVGNCSICLCEFQNPVALNNCGHIFCRQCILHAFKVKLACPICGLLYGRLVGDQPVGTMEVEKIPLPSSLPGYPDAGTIIINYNIPSGIQNESHPNPGSRYVGTYRTAYLPDNDEGRDICRLLRKAFDAKLTFTVGRSVTTGRNDTVTWNDIHHKTCMTGGPSQFGYPDDTYLQRVRAELAVKGIR